MNKQTILESIGKSRAHAKPKTLHLTLKRKWFDMIASGEKKEEYREIKPYWRVRLTEPRKCPNEWAFPVFSKYDVVKFRNGYNLNSPTISVRWKHTRIGRGNSAWGAPTNRDVFVITIGEMVEKETQNK